MSTVVAFPEKRGEISFRHALMATDFSEASQRTLAWAKVFASIYASELVLVHVLTAKANRPVPLPPVLRESDAEWIAANRRLKDLAEDAHLEAVAHRCFVEEGDVWEALSAVIEREVIDLLVLGDHGCGGLKKLIVGSVAEELLRMAPCPTVIVGPDVPLPTAAMMKFNTILYVADFGPASIAAFNYALSLAEHCGAKLVLQHAMEPLSVLDTGPAAYGPGDYVARELLDWRSKAQAESLQKLKGLIPGDARLSSEPEFVVERAFLPDGIISAAARYAAELIVMGITKPRSPRLAAHLPGELVHEVICRAKCPVMTVRS